MRDMQLEYNRCREGLKEQRIAGRPFTAVVAGSMDEDDMEKLTNREANAVIELNALQPQPGRQTASSTLRRSRHRSKPLRSKSGL